MYQKTKKKGLYIYTTNTSFSNRLTWFPVSAIVIYRQILFYYDFYINFVTYFC